MKRIALSLLLALSLATRAAFASTNEVTTSQQYTQGQQVQATDLSGDFEAVRNLSGILATLLLGTPNALPNQNPLAVTLSPSALSLSIGGAGQFVIAQDVASSGNARLIDSCPAQSLTIPANNGNTTRTDLLSIQYQQIPVNAHNVTFSDGSVRTVYNAVEGCAYAYNASSSTPPAGYVAFAQITVPPGATTASQGTVTYLFSTVKALLQQQLGGVVSSINSAYGALVLQGSAGINVSTSGNVVTIGTTIPTNPVTSINGNTGPVTIESTGGSITVTTPDSSHINLKANFPAAVNALNGATGNVSILGGTGITVLTSGNNVTLTNTGVTLLNGQYNSVSVTSNNGSVAVNTTAGDIDLGTNFIYDEAASTFRPTGRACVGTAVTNSASAIVVTCGTTILSGTAVFYDSTFSNSVVLSVKSVSGNTITFGARYTNTNTPTGSGLGVYYTVFAY